MTKFERVFVVLDGDFTRTDGAPSSNRTHYENFSKRYTTVFNDVSLLCRVHDIEEAGALAVEGPGVKVIALPPVHGPADLLRFGPSILKTFFSIPRKSPVILRVPGIFPAIAWMVLTLRGMPFAVEAMADADAQFAPGAYKKRFRAFYRVIWTAIMKAQCRMAAVSSYVTARSLQADYPPNPKRPTFNYTTLDLSPDHLAAAPRSAESLGKERLTLVNVAMMQKHLKGQDLIIEAVAILKSRGVLVDLWLVGDGDTRAEFEAQAAALGVADQVRFLGKKKAGAEVYAILDQTDLFVLPSRQEGLPRVVIEAQARGLPCVCSQLPGNTELVGPEFLVPQDDAKGWADVVGRLAADRDELVRASAVNLENARSYTTTAVYPVREAFYTRVAESAQS